MPGGWGKFVWPVALLAIALGGGVFVSRWGNLLSGFSGDETIKPWQLQAVVSLFCFSPLPWKLDKASLEVDELGDKYDFTNEGDVNEDDYSKASIYALLYSFYQANGKTKSPSGIDYQFTFNTWGISNVDWIESEAEPQRHGRAAYRGLVEFKDVRRYLEANPNPQIVEIGCGTGAGGNYITQVIPGCNYTALDMQRAAIDTCNLLHAQHNPRLKCEHVPGGVGGLSGSKAPMPDGSVDIVVISETHIAESTIGPEEMAIFKEIIRMLRPGGFFLWGNALPTSVWHASLPILAELGMVACGSFNHTQGAIQARLEDEDRVDLYLESLLNYFPVMSIPAVGKHCGQVMDRLIKNFYRHPGTKLFKQMETGAHSYMHLCHRRSP